MKKKVAELHLKSYVVRDKGGKLTFPSTIPKKRSSIRMFILGCFILYSCISEFYEIKDFKLTLEMFSYTIAIYFIVEFIDRIILSFEELMNHFQPRYGKSLIKVLKHTFYFSEGACLIMISSLAIVGKFYSEHGFIDTTKLHKFSYLKSLFLLLFLRKVLKIEHAPIYNSLKFEDNDGLSYSTAMANSFYHGYLKLILPKTSGEDKNLMEIIDIYSDRNKVDVFPKLFILVPKSAFCQISLKSSISPSIEESSSLDEKKLTIAGVQKRSYKNSVYKIRDPNNPRKVYYVCAEYATPLRTFKASLDFSGLFNETFKKHADDIVLNFYLIMRDFVRNDPDICDLCELIYYDDRDEHGLRDIAPLLLSKVKKQNRSLV
ncbi:stimulator of interferon genes protein [Harmonia axyridis]|uniref:stimulator of interferon genes protein n=1 Tax=Harmonia axyridis TaxID=115357 RepID=UPI001E274ED6|nr:stimulator of interferon genes protein [Harmonia axyridis]XP_045475745.1 stimulator of interferon genes protein [Harmonia axyridis]